MKLKYPFILTAALVCCLSCVSTNLELGGNLVPVDQTYKIYCDTVFFAGENAAAITNRAADSLSGYSNSRVTIGAVRDEYNRLCTRSSAITLIPMYDSVLNLGTNPEFQSFVLYLLRDSVSVADRNQANIIQNVKVSALSKAIDPAKDYDINSKPSVKAGSITNGTPIISAEDNLVVFFTKEFAQPFLDLKNEDVQDIDTFLEKIPGIYIQTDEPEGRGGRINIFDLQLAYDSSDGISGNYAQIEFSAEFEGERKDTNLIFLLGALDFYDIDSLLTNGTIGELPQYALNVTTQESSDLIGLADEKLYCEGGGGLKPVVSAKSIKDMVSSLVASKGGDPTGTVINKASLVFPYEYDASKYEEGYKYPQILSPTCRLRSDTTVVFMGLTDASSSDENQGDINRSTSRYSPDITYHVQELLKMDDDKLASGNYDIWLLNVANETVTTTSSSSSDEMSEYYQYLAYQSYYNSMYGGYGGYGGYGYGSYGGYGYNSYNNYYSYMMAAMYANTSSTTTQTESQIDKDRYYWAPLNGPQSQNPPMLVVTYSIPNSR